jgi:hypothetical protein
MTCRVHVKYDGTRRPTGCAKYSLIWVTSQSEQYARLESENFEQGSHPVCAILPTVVLK